MPADFSSNCECSSCLEGTQSENDWNPSSRTEDDDFLYPTSRKKCLVSPIMQRFLSQCYSSTLENDNQEDLMFPASEKKSFMEFLRETPGDTKRKTKPLRELTIQELLRESEANFMSLGQFRDHMVMKFRRTLYHSGIRVKHVQGQRLKRHFSANYFKRNPSRLHRLVPWLKRELTAMYGDYGYTVKNILAAILHHMTKFDLDSESFCDLLEPYLLQYTYHFLHEFISFVDSSYNMETYDRQAIYRFPSASIWLKNETTASIPALPLPKDHARRTYQQAIKQSENSQVQRSKMEERPQCSYKQFPNSNLFSNDSKILPFPHNTANKTHVWTKDVSKADDYKSIDSANAMFPIWAATRERGRDILNCQRNVQKKKTEEAMLLPGHVQDPRKSVYNLRETTTLSPNQQIKPRINHKH